LRKKQKFRFTLYSKGWVYIQILPSESESEFLLERVNLIQILVYPKSVSESERFDELSELCPETSRFPVSRAR